MSLPKDAVVTLTALLFAASLAAPAGAGARAEDGETSAPERARPAAERLGLRKGSHQVTLFGGLAFGQTARDHDIVAAPLDAEVTAIRLEVEDDTTLGLRYAYQVHEHWGLELSLAQTGTELASPRSFDRAAAEERIQNSATPDGTTLTDAQQVVLLDRIESHSLPHGIDVTYVDLDALYVINPDARLIVEIGAGLGWASGELDDEPAVFEELVTSFCDPTDPSCIVVIANELEDPTGGLGCPADNDPCVTAEGESGLSWNLIGGLRYAVSDRIHLRGNGRLRFVEQVIDPGDSFMTGELTVGVSFVFGGGRG